jgi:hypothetical protein
MFLDTRAVLDEVFKDVYIPFDCEFLVAQQEGTVSLTEVYRISDGQPLQMHRVADWSYETGFVWTATSFYKRRGDLQGLLIIGSAYPQVP